MSEVSFSKSDERLLAIAKEAEKADRLVRVFRSLMIVGGLGCLLMIIVGTAAILEGRTHWGLMWTAFGLVFFGYLGNQVAYYQLQARTLSRINKLKNPSALSASSAVNSPSGD